MAHRIRHVAAPVLAAMALLHLGACQQPAPGPAASAGASPRARVRLDQIKPAPQLPPETAAPTAEPVPQALRYLRTGQERFDERLWSDATTALEKALQIDPQLAEARVLLARTALQHGNAALAENHLQEAVKTRPRDPAIHRLRGEIALQDRRYGDAIEALRTALLAGSSTPDSPEVVLAHLSLALALKEEGYLAAAADEFEWFAAATAEPTRAMEDYHELKEAMLLYRGKLAATIGDIRAELGESELAIAAYERAAAENPEDKTIRRRLATALARGGRTAEAIESVRTLMKESPDDGSALDLLKDVCELSKEPSRFDEELVALAREAASPEMRRRLAQMLLERKKIAEASDILSRLVDDQPEDAEAAYQLARLYLEQKKVGTALEMFARTLRRHPATYRRVFDVFLGADAPNIDVSEIRALIAQHPEDAASQYLLALSVWADAASAEKAAREALRLDEDFAPAQVLLGTLAIQNQRWEDAAKSADEAIDGGIADAPVYLMKGRALEALDQFQEAETALLESFRLDRKSAEPLFVLAESTERRGELLRSEQIYRRIVDDVDPKHKGARERLVRLLLNTRKTAKAKEYLSDFERLDQSGAAVDRCRALLDLATSRAPDGQDRLAEYRQALGEIIKKHPKDPATYVELAMSYEAVSEFESALAEVRAALEIDANDLRALERKAKYQIKLLDFDGAADSTTALLKLRPRDIDLQQRLADLAFGQGDFDTAAQRFQAMLKRKDLNERHEVVVRRLLNVLLLDRRGDDAVAAAKDWLDLAPSDANRRGLYLAALRLAERPGDAVDAAKDWLSADPTDPELRAQFIGQLIGAKRYVEAEQRVLGWMSSDADDLTLNRLLIQISLAARKWDSAIDLARTGTEISEQHDEYELLLAWCYRKARRFDEAIELYRDRANESENPGVTGTLIDVLINAERFREAEDIATGALTPNRDERDASRGVELIKILGMRNHLVRIYQLMGRELQAAQQLEEILQMLPPDSGDPRAPFYDRYVGVNNDLGYTWADAGIHLDKAEKMIRFAIGEQPTRGAYVDSLGWVLYKRGKFDEAISYLRRAIRLVDSEDAVLYDHLGDALYRVDKITEAKTYWEKALASRKPDEDPPPNPEDRRVLARIKEKLDALAQEKEAPVAPLAKDDPSSDPGKPPTNADDNKPVATTAPSKRPLPVSPRQ